MKKDAKKNILISAAGDLKWNEALLETLWQSHNGSHTWVEPECYIANRLTGSGSVPTDWKMDYFGKMFVLLN